MEPAHEREDRYVTAAGVRGLTRFYDSIVAVTMRERLFRGRLAEQVTADLPDGARIADVGAGTGTFAIMLAAAAPAVAIFDGFDGIRDHAAGRLPLFLEDAGFPQVKRHDRLRTAWGSLELLSAERR